MTCEYCGKDFSKSVYLIHIKMCKDRTKEPKKTEKKSLSKPTTEKTEEIDIQRGLITAELDERGIKYNARKSTKNLLTILEDAKKEAE